MNVLVTYFHLPYTENYRQSYSIRTAKDWNALPQSVVSAGSLALLKLFSRTIVVHPVGVMPQFWGPAD